MSIYSNVCSIVAYIHVASQNEEEKELAKPTTISTYTHAQ